MGGGLTGPQPKVFERSNNHFGKSKAEEKRWASRLGGRRLARSGGMATSRYDSTTAGGDIQTSDMFIEHKRAEPTTKSIGITRSWLAKVTQGAKRRTLQPIMGLTFEKPVGHARDWVLMPLDLAEVLLRELNEEGDEA